MGSASDESKELDKERKRLAEERKVREKELQSKRIEQLRRMRFGAPSLLDIGDEGDTLG